MIRVLMAEDSATTREYLTHLLALDSELHLVGVARDGIEAIEMTPRLQPDIVLIDVHMPRMDGHEATRHIMENWPRPVVMMSASSSREDTLRALDALKAGALTLVSKPGGLDHPRHAEDVRSLLDTVKLMAEVKVVRRW
ncbi:MAG: response regulator, partial [Chloroflexota bacterium]